MQNFVYLLEDEESREAIVIDFGWETDPILKLTSGMNMRVKYICATHGHFDHVKTIEKLAAELGYLEVRDERRESDSHPGAHRGQRLLLRWESSFHGGHALHRCMGANRLARRLYCEAIFELTRCDHVPA